MIAAGTFTNRFPYRTIVKCLSRPKIAGQCPNVYPRPLHDEADLAGARNQVELATSPGNTWRTVGLIRRLRLPEFVGWV